MVITYIKQVELTDPLQTTQNDPSDDLQSKQAMQYNTIQNTVVHKYTFDVFLKIYSSRRGT